MNNVRLSRAGQESGLTEVFTGDIIRSITLIATMMTIDDDERWGFYPRGTEFFTFWIRIWSLSVLRRFGSDVVDKAKKTTQKCVVLRSVNFIKSRSDQLILCQNILIMSSTAQRISFIPNMMT